LREAIVAKRTSDVETEGRTLGGMARVYDLVCTLGACGTGFKRRIVQLGHLKRDDRVLDVGCGTGVLTLLAREQAEEVAGIDAAPEMIAAAQSKAQRKGVNIDFRPALIEDLPYPDGHFDLVFSSLMVHHLPPAVKVSGLREVHRVLRAGGRFIVVDFDRRGRLPILLRDAGFTDVRSLGKTWLFNLVSRWEARKS
jgi:ubiquinone/menaquinone biosynthesis C-methylase UbiE